MVGVKAWVVLIAHVPHSRDALTRAKAAKPRRGSECRRGTRTGGGWECEKVILKLEV